MIQSRVERPREGTEAAVERYAHMALILALSVLGIAGAYFAALYVISH